MHVSLERVHAIYLRASVYSQWNGGPQFWLIIRKFTETQNSCLKDLCPHYLLSVRSKGQSRKCMLEDVWLRGDAQSIGKSLRKHGALVLI